ncbi:MAG: class I SAM-dependent methyltransferase [Kibdelosporangium sp.]
MSDFKSIVMNEGLYNYVLAQAEPPTDVQAGLVTQTLALGSSAEMQVPHEQSVLLNLLVKISGARKVVEVGTFTGYSTLAMASALPADGQVIACDVSEQWTEIARAAWAAAGVSDKIELRIGPAADTLRGMPEDGDIDLVFIDADKTGYLEYWELLVPRVRPGGLLLVDNVLYGGEVIVDSPSVNAEAIADFNAHVRADDRVESVLLPVADGLTVARKK